MAARPKEAPAATESVGQLGLFGDATVESNRGVASPGVSDRSPPIRAELKAVPIGRAAPSSRMAGVLADADRAVLAALEAALTDARASADDRAPLVVLASCLGQLGAPSDGQSPPAPPSSAVSLRQARDGWLRRLETSQKSQSALVAYRVAIDDLLDWSEANGRDVMEEATVVDYLSGYQQRAHPAPATYYRRFLLLRRFLRWVSRRSGTRDPFLDLEPPPKPRQERDWLTRDEFRRLLDAAGRPQRNLPGLIERDRLALLALVTTGLRRSELCALEWRDLELDGRKRSLLVRCGKGGKPRRQPVPVGLARELRALRDSRHPDPSDPVFCGLAGGRLQETTLADIIRRATARAGIEKHVTAHTLRHTAATWLRQEVGDTRLVAEYLGHADLSTVSRYAHVERDELFDAAGRLEELAAASEESAGPDLPAGRRDADPSSSESNQPRGRRRRRRRRRGRH